jgi:hypothetical protein
LKIRIFLLSNNFNKIVSFTPLESPTIYGGNNINKASIPYRKGGVKAPSFLTGFIYIPTLFSKWRRMPRNGQKSLGAD